MTVLVRDGSCLPPLQDPVVVSIGNFDGLHRGHQSVLQKLQSVGEPESSRVLMSFYPHPSVVLGYAKEMPRISSWRSMLELLEGYGISVFYLKHFTRAFSKVGAVDFCRELLVNELRAAHVVVGEDAAVGKGREGTPERLKEILAPENCQLHVVDFIKN
ncbi:MAG: hypothetical protein KDD62_04280, partial [Bdellovibrionales bacterium]|nr:hypothetical protein [Bdellovibrionales bacterium]